MVHNIYVCLEHKRLMHGARNTGIHSKKHHKELYFVLEREGIIVQIGECPNDLWRPCKDPHDRDATEQEIKLAFSLKDKRVKYLKEEYDKMRQGIYE